MLRIALEIQSGLRGDYFGQTEIADTREILRTLWNSVDSQIAVEWVRRTFGILQREEVLFCGLCEQGTCRAEAKFAAVYGEKWTTACKAYDTGCPMRYLRENWANMGTSQGRESFEQFARKLGKAVHELSCKTSPAEAFLYYLRETSESEGFMSASLLGIPICGTAWKRTACDAQTGISETGGGVAAVCYGISSYESNAMKSGNPFSGIYEADTSRTLDMNGGNPACNQGGIAIVQLYENHGQDSRITGPLDVSPTVSRKYGTGGNNVPLVMEHTNYSVRRLTPLEAERLQGYPDGWTDVEIKIEIQPKRKGIGRLLDPIKPLPKIKKPSDSARYRALGNSFAIPNAYFVISRCVAVMEGINT